MGFQAVSDLVLGPSQLEFRHQMTTRDVGGLQSRKAFATIAHLL